MASVSASHIILFVASMVVAAGIAGTVVLEVNQLSDAVETRGSNTAEEIATDIEITSDEGSEASIYDPGANDEDGQVTLLIKNTGSSSLGVQASEIDLLVDGRYVPSDAITVDRVDIAGDSWRPGGVVEVTIDLDAAADLAVSGDTRVTAIVNDNEDAIAFYADDGS